MHPPRESTGRPRTIPRRALLGSAAGVAMLAAAGCNPLSTARPTVTVTAEAPKPIEPMVNLIATTRLHMLRLQSAVLVDKAAAPMLQALLVDRRAHLEALQAEYLRTKPSPVDPIATAPATGTVPVPTDPAAAMGDIRKDAADGQGQFTDAMGPASRYRAALFGSIAACLATHRAVLA